MKEYKSKVYVLLDKENRIISIDGGYTTSNIQNIDEWTLIDEGEGDRYNLCQSNYLNSPLLTEDGICRWKLSRNKCVLRSDAEIAEDRTNQPPPEPTAEERMEAQVLYTALMTDTLLEE